MHQRKVNDVEPTETILRNTRKVLVQLSNKFYDKFRAHPFWFVVTCSLFGSVIMDSDHFLSPLFQQSRPLHLPVLFLALCFLGYYSSRIIRLNKHRVGE